MPHFRAIIFIKIVISVILKHNNVLAISHIYGMRIYCTIGINSNMFTRLVARYRDSMFNRDGEKLALL